jgi:AcrR family transcriptional regulator
MPSPVKASQTTDKLVLAAGQLFAHQGYHGTSTREIARLAGVSENTLFRHFDYKEDLFWSALLRHTNGLRFGRDLEDGLGQCGPVDTVLPKIFELLNDTAILSPELWRLIAVAFLELNWKAEAFCQEHLSPMLSAIHQYLALNIRVGRIRNLDPAMLTLAFLAPGVMSPGLYKLIVGRQQSDADSRDTAHAYAIFWLDVLTPSELPNAGEGVPIATIPQVARS